MRFTTAYLSWISDGFRALGDFACSPFSWAMKGMGEHNTETDNFTNDAMGCMLCLACDFAVCMCKTPVACVGSVATVPLAGSAAVILTALGITALPFVAAADGVDACVKCCKGQETAVDKKVDESTVVDENTIIEIPERPSSTQLKTA